MSKLVSGAGKEKLDLEAFFNHLFTSAKGADITHLEAVIEEKSGLSVSINQGELEGFTVSEETTAALRGLHKGQMGMTYTEQINEVHIEDMIKALVESASLGNEASWLVPDHTKDGTIQKDFPFPISYREIALQEKIDFALTLEAYAKRADLKVKKTDYCQYNEFKIRRQMRRTDGLILSETQANCMAEVSAVAELIGEVRTGTSHNTGSRMDLMSAEQIGTEAGKLAAASLNAKTLKSGKYPVILKNNVAAALLEGFLPVFYGDRVLYQMSRLGQELGQTVANSKVSLIDDPHMIGGGRTTYFDDEGVLTSEIKVIEEGVLKTFLHNRKTAAAFQTTSTGNGFRTNLKSGVEVSATNFRLENGSEALEEMQKRFREGVLVTDVQGTFAGINSLSGDFSLQASGFWIQEGRVKNAVKDITISGNFYEMLKAIEGIANDMKFGLPFGTHVGSPSLWVKALSVAGE